MTDLPLDPELYGGALIRQSTVLREFLDNMPESSFFLLRRRDPGFPSPAAVPGRIVYYRRSDINRYFGNLATKPHERPPVARGGRQTRTGRAAIRKGDAT
jgi:hypothetical protein